MNMEERKQVLEKALINSFVDEYASYKNIVKIINKDLKRSEINYKYTYNEFCLEFLNESLKNIEKIDIFSNADHFSQFLVNFYQFNLYILQSMFKNKIEDLGYKNEENNEIPESL